MGKHESLDGKTRVARYRAGMRAKGYRLKQFWVPDLRLPHIRNQIAKEVAALAADPRRDEEQAWVDAVTDWDGLPPYDDGPLPDKGSPDR